MIRKPTHDTEMMRQKQHRHGHTGDAQHVEMAADPLDGAVIPHPSGEGSHRFHTSRPQCERTRRRERPRRKGR